MKKGFTLLEVLVAFVILSTTIIAVFQVFSQGFGTLSKLSTYQDLYLTLNNLMETIDTENDFETNKSRSGRVGRFDYEWTATPVAAPRQPAGVALEVTLPFAIGFYKIDLRVYLGAKSDSQKYREFTFFKTGWSYAAR